MELLRAFIREIYVDKLDSRLSFKEIYDDFRIWTTSRYGAPIWNRMSQKQIYADMKTIPEYGHVRRSEGYCLRGIARRLDIPNNQNNRHLTLSVASKVRTVEGQTLPISNPPTNPPANLTHSVEMIPPITPSEISPSVDLTVSTDTILTTSSEISPPISLARSTDAVPPMEPNEISLPISSTGAVLPITSNQVNSPLKLIISRSTIPSTPSTPSNETNLVPNSPPSINGSPPTNAPPVANINSSQSTNTRPRVANINSSRSRNVSSPVSKVNPSPPINLPPVLISKGSPLTYLSYPGANPSSLQVPTDNSYLAVNNTSPTSKPPMYQPPAKSQSTTRVTPKINTGSYSNRTNTATKPREIPSTVPRSLELIDPPLAKRRPQHQ
jgi:hypothetical protein